MIKFKIHQDAWFSLIHLPHITHMVVGQGGEIPLTSSLVHLHFPAFFIKNLTSLLYAYYLLVSSRFRKINPCKKLQKNTQYSHTHP